MSPHDKTRTTHRVLTGSLVVLMALFAGSSVAVGGVIMPDFQLTDVNSTSSTYNQAVSPRDYLQQVSGWYFGHAT